VMRNRLLMAVLSLLLLVNAGLLQAAPVGSTIWLHYTGPDADGLPADFYVEMDPGRDDALIALRSTSVGTNEQFIVEDAGSGNILLKSVANAMYATAIVPTILRANTTSTTDPLALFQWIDNGDDTISLYNSSLSKYVKVQGANQYLKLTRDTQETDTIFTWGVVTPSGPDTDPPMIDPASFATAPIAVGSAVVTMTATTGSDATGPVEYFFAETSGNPGSDNSGWQTSPTYSDGGLTPETEYTYTVSMRDAVTPTPNVGSPSAPAGATTGTDTGPQKPNIVFILADDLGYGDLSCQGHPDIQTPRLDTLAAEGSRFESFHVTGITCNPSRTGFMTSIHPASYPGYPADHGFADKVTVTELMHKNGYKVGHFGKWHIGPEEIEKTGTYGIDDLAVLGGNNDTIDGRDAGLFTAAKEFIEANKDVPFYVNVWGHISHTPVDPNPDLVALFDDFVLDRNDYNYGSYWQQDKFDLAQEIVDAYFPSEDLTVGMRKYIADVYSLDAQVGSLLDKLDELGLRDNTIVVFSSDQGAAPVWSIEKLINRGDDPDIIRNMLGTGGTWSGGKHTQLEGGVRSPFIIRWPDNVPAGVVNSTSTISALDWLPTMCSIAAIDIGSLEVEGQDITDILLGATRSPDRPLFWKTSSTNSPPSMLDGLSGRWKMHAPNISSSNPDELFDLVADPEELIDVASATPSIAGPMSAAIDAWVATLPTSYDKGDPPVTPLYPSANAGLDQTVDDLDYNGIEAVTLDGAASSDPDGYISGYIWRENGQIIGHTDGPTVILPLGTHTIEVEVTDYAGNTDFDTVTITVTTPSLDPDLTGLATIGTRWLDTGCIAPGWCDGTDLDQSGDVGIDDVLILTEYWLDFLAQ
jgi:arylsulfatase A-like enzyme